MPWRDRLNDPHRLRLHRQLPRRPVRHRQVQLLRVATGQSDEVGQLCRGELAGTAASLAVAQDLDDHRLQLVVGDVFGAGGRQPVVGLGEPPTPSSDALGIDAELRGHVDRVFAGGRAEHDVHALGEPSFDGARPPQLLEEKALAREQLDRGGASTHRPTLILAIGEVNLSDLPPA